MSDFERAEQSHEPSRRSLMFVFVQKKKSMRENKPLVGYSLKWKFEFSMQSLRRGTFIFKKQKN